MANMHQKLEKVEGNLNIFLQMCMFLFKLFLAFSGFWRILAIFCLLIWTDLVWVAHLICCRLAGLWLCAFLRYDPWVIWLVLVEGQENRIGDDIFSARHYFSRYHWTHSGQHEPASVIVSCLVVNAFGRVMSAVFWLATVVAIALDGIMPRFPGLLPVFSTQFRSTYMRARSLTQSELCCVPHWIVRLRAQQIGAESKTNRAPAVVFSLWWTSSIFVWSFCF